MNHAAIRSRTLIAYIKSTLNVHLQDSGRQNIIGSRRHKPMDRLPYEILLKIFQYAGNEHVYRGLSQVNRYARFVSQDPFLWKGMNMPAYADMELTNDEIARIADFRTDFFIQSQINSQVTSLLDRLTKQEGNRYETVVGIQRFGKRARLVLKDTIHKFGGPQAASISQIDTIYYAYRVLESIDRAFAAQTLVNIWNDPSETNDVDMVLAFESFCLKHNDPDRLHFTMGGLTARIKAELMVLKVDFSKQEILSIRLWLLVCRLKLGGVLEFWRNVAVYLHIARQLNLKADYCPLPTVHWVRIQGGDGEFYVDLDRTRVRRPRDLVHVVQLSRLPIPRFDKRSQLKELARLLISRRSTLKKEYVLLASIIFHMFDFDREPDANPVSVTHVVEYPYDMLLYEILERNLGRDKIPSSLFCEKDRIERVLSFGQSELRERTPASKNDDIEFKIGQVVYVLTTGYFGVVFGWYFEDNVLFYKVYGDKRYGARFVRRNNLATRPFTLDEIYEIIAWDSCGIGCYFSGYDVRAQKFKASVSLQHVYPEYKC